MWRYVRRRLVLAVLTFWAVSTIVWGLLYLTGDPVAILLAGTPAGQTDVEQLRHALGFDRPLPIQYLHFLSAAVQGDLDRKSTRLNSSHVEISYAVFCLK